MKILSDGFVDEHLFHESNEAKLLKDLTSPYIVEYEDCFFQADRFFIVTEYCKVNFKFLDIIYKKRKIDENKIGWRLVV